MSLLNAIGESQKPVGTKTNIMSPFMVRGKHGNKAATFSHSARPQSHFTTNTSRQVSAVRRHENKDRGEQLQYHRGSPRSSSPGGGERIITANTVTQVSLSAAFTALFHNVEKHRKRFTSGL